MLARGLRDPSAPPSQDMCIFSRSKASRNWLTFPVFILGLKNDPREPNKAESDPRWGPKVTPKPCKCIRLNPSKHVVFTVWKLHWAIWGGVGSEVFFCLFSCYQFFQVPDDFIRLWGPHDARNGLPDRSQIVHFFTKLPTSVHIGARRGLGRRNHSQTCTPGYPGRVKMEGPGIAFASIWTPARL